MYSKSLIFLLIKLDQQLACIYGSLSAAPFNKVLEAFWIFKDRADRTQAHTFEALLTCLSQVEQDIDSFDIKEMQFRALVSKNSVGQAINNREYKSTCISRLFNLRICQIRLQIFNSFHPSKFFLIISVSVANI